MPWWPGTHPTRDTWGLYTCTHRSQHSLISSVVTSLFASSDWRHPRATKGEVHFCSVKVHGSYIQMNGHSVRVQAGLRVFCSLSGSSSDRKLLKHLSLRIAVHMHRKRSNSTEPVMNKGLNDLRLVPGEGRTQISLATTSILALASDQCRESFY
jgi:hypothetical protein